jgi:hypothetical protein
METQMAPHAALVDLLYMCACPQHQLVYEVEDADMLRNAIKLAFSYLSSTQLHLNAA